MLVRTQAQPFVDSSGYQRGALHIEGTARFLSTAAAARCCFVIDTPVERGVGYRNRLQGGQAKSKLRKRTQMSLRSTFKTTLFLFLTLLLIEWSKKEYVFHLSSRDRKRRRDDPITSRQVVCCTPETPQSSGSTAESRPTDITSTIEPIAFWVYERHRPRQSFELDADMDSIPARNALPSSSSSRSRTHARSLVLRHLRPPATEAQRNEESVVSWLTL